MNISIGKRTRIGIGVGLIAIGMATIVFAPTQPKDLSRLGQLPIDLGFLCLLWAFSKGAFWKPLATRAGVVVRRILIFSALLTGFFALHITAVAAKSSTDRQTFFVLSIVCGLGAVAYAIWMLVLWFRSLYRRVRTPRPIPTTPGSEELRRVLFLFRAGFSVLFIICGATVLVQGHPIFAAFFIVFGLLAALGAYRTRKRTASVQDPPPGFAGTPP